MTALEWSPELPADWKVEQARRVLRRVKRPVRTDDQTVTAFRDGEVTLRSNRRTEGFTEAFAEFGYHGVREGDLAIHAMDGFAGAIGVSDSDGKVSPVVHLYDAGLGDARFFAYALREAARAGFVTSLAKGIRERSTSFDPQTLAAMDLPVPQPIMQRRIADYLDRETATIDALIEKQNALLLLLRERRSQLPTRVLSEVAGTRMQLRHVVADITDCPHWTPEQADSFDYAAVRSGSIRNGMYRHSASVPVDRETFIARHGAKVVPGNVLFAREAPAGEACLVPDDFQLCLGQRTVLIECDSKKLLPELVVANIYTRGVQDYFANASFGSTVANVRLPVLRATRVVVPPLNEQREIAEHLDRETAKIDALIAKAERFIELAQERRAALITAAVTGQIEIPTED